jgi:two-component system response regulator AtoC
VVLSDGDRLTAADVERELGRQATLGGLTEAAGPVGKDGASPAGSLEESRRDAEREAITAALERSGNNRTVAARLLGISRRTLYHKLAEHELL